MSMRVLAPIDGSEQAFAALRFAVDFAKRYGATLDLFYVAPESAPPESLLQYAEAEHIGTSSPEIYMAIGKGVLDAGTEIAHAGDVLDVERHLEFGDPAHAILDYAAHHAVDVVIMGTRGLGKLKGLLLGSVSLKVSSLAPCTCIVVR